jgi:hypothetical protein
VIAVLRAPGNIMWYQITYQEAYRLWFAIT